MRVIFAATFIADTKRALLVWEPPRPTPVYYFPKEDVRASVLVPSSHKRPSPTMGEASYWDVHVDDRVAPSAAWTYLSSPPGTPDVSAYVAFKWDMMDAWFEEDDEVFVHPRDPHHRVDVMNSSRHVRVEIAGVTVADSKRPRLLFETSLPVRYYLPKQDVRMELLTPSATVTHCPYKGTTVHWHFDKSGERIDDVAWTYHLPTPTCEKIADLLAFYNERVDAVYVDDELQPVPLTPWSRSREAHGWRKPQGSED